MSWPGCSANGVLGPPGTGRRPQVNVTVAASTLLGIDDQPAELDGHGPIPAVLARALAVDPTGTWRRLLTDDHGRLVDVTSHTYRPPARWPGSSGCSSRVAVTPAAVGAPWRASSTTSSRGQKARPPPPICTHCARDITT
jgi:hypothetical protein